LCNKIFQVSEIEVKAAQLLKLIESLEDYMIQETTKKLTKDLNLAFAERGREESALPTDLWKRPVSGFNTTSQFIYSVMTPWLDVKFGILCNLVLIYNWLVFKLYLNLFIHIKC